MDVDHELMEDEEYMDELSENPNFDPNLLLAYPDANWDWIGVSMNPAITWDFVLNNPRLHWDFYEGLSNNPNITLEIIKVYPNLNWDFEAIAKREQQPYTKESIYTATHNYVEALKQYNISQIIQQFTNK